MGGRQVGNRTESRRLEVGGSGAEISFYGRVTNLRTRHCRVPADGRTMRLRNTMLHSGNLKAVLTTNLQPPIPPPLCVPLRQYSLLRHIPIPPPRLPTAPSCHPPGLRRYFLILLLLPWLPLLRENPVSSQLPRPFVASDDRQVHVRKSTNLAGGGRARVSETQSSKDGRNIAETSLLKITRHFCFPIAGYSRSIFILCEFTLAQAHIHIPLIVIQNIKGAETTVASTVAGPERGGNKHGGRKADIRAYFNRS